MINDHVADMITRIRNAQRAGHRLTVVTASRMNKSVLEVLKREGLIESFESTQDTAGHPALKVFLKYYSSGKPVISRVVRVSKAGCRKYVPADRLPRVHSGLGLAILSTSKGVMSDLDARKQRVGGEVLAVFG